MQRQEEEEEEENIQAKEAPCNNPQLTPQIAANINALRGSGQPLPENTRQFFEPRFGVDFGGVRVHTNAQAIQSAQQINAKAYTTDKDIVFGAGHYAPETNEGQQLLAHELTHVIQQNSRNINSKHQLISQTILQRDEAPIEQETNEDLELQLDPNQIALLGFILRGENYLSGSVGIDDPVGLLGLSDLPSAELFGELQYSNRCNRTFQDSSIRLGHDINSDVFRARLGTALRIGNVRLSPNFSVQIRDRTLDSFFINLSASRISSRIPDECLPRPSHQKVKPPTDDPPPHQKVKPPIDYPPPPPPPPRRTTLPRYSLYFFYDSTIRRPQSNADFYQLSRLLRAFPKLQVHITGHASLEGTDEYNLDLSRRRAQAVRDILVILEGIDASRMSTDWKGETAPAVPGVQARSLLDPSIERVRNQNRRVEVLLFDPTGRFELTEFTLERDLGNFNPQPSLNQSTGDQVINRIIQPKIQTHLPETKKIIQLSLRENAGELAQLQQLPDDIKPNAQTSELGRFSGLPMEVQRKPETETTCGPSELFTEIATPFYLQNYYFYEDTPMQKSQWQSVLAKERKEKCESTGSFKDIELNWDLGNPKLGSIKILGFEIDINKNSTNFNINPHIMYMGAPCCPCFTGTASWKLDVEATRFKKDGTITGRTKNPISGSKSGQKCVGMKCCDVKKTAQIDLWTRYKNTYTNIFGNVDIIGETYQIKPFQQGSNVGLRAEFPDSGSHLILSAGLKWSIFQWVNSAVTAGIRVDLPLDDPKAFQIAASGSVERKLIGNLIGRLFATGSLTPFVGGTASAQIGTGVSFPIGPVEIDASFFALRWASSEEAVRQPLASIGIKKYF